MARESLTIQLHYEGTWHEAAELVVSETEDGADSRTQLTYRDDYLVEHIEGFQARDERAVSERHPLDFEVWTNDHWSAFVFDIVPSGAARNWWRRRLGAKFETEKQLDWLMLREHTVAPIGNVRIASSVTEPADPIGFEKEQVCERDSAFLEEAAERGAAVGGATGAGGEAPKILLAEGRDGAVYPEGALPDHQTAASWLVKWPRGKTRADHIVLETEYLYAHVLAELGFDTCPGEWRAAGENKPSLWLPRFDRSIEEDRIERLAVESLYSLSGVHRPGSVVSHQTFIGVVVQALKERGQDEDIVHMVREYVFRDFVDVVLGNSDNHGRNRAVLRGAKLRWAPIYDLAPMILDPAGITRSTRWNTHEYGGRIDWLGVCRELEGEHPGLNMEESLHKLSERLLALPELLRERGVDDKILEHPRIPLGRLPEVLENWGLA